MMRLDTLSKIFSYRTVLLLILCLVGINIVATSDAARGKRRVVKDNRVYLIHSDELKFDIQIQFASGGGLNLTFFGQSLAVDLYTDTLRAAAFSFILCRIELFLELLQLPLHLLNLC